MSNRKLMNQPINHNDDYLAMLNAIRYCLKDRYFYQRVWTWLYDLIRHLSGDNTFSIRIQSSVIVGILCPIMSGPYDFQNEYEMWTINKILDCYNNDATRWIAIEGFSEYTFNEALNAIDLLNNISKATKYHLS